MAEIVIVLTEGLVDQVYSTDPTITVRVLDFDREDEDEDDRIEWLRENADLLVENYAEGVPLSPPRPLDKDREDLEEVDLNDLGVNLTVAPHAIY